MHKHNQSLLWPGLLQITCWIIGLAIVTLLYQTPVMAAVSATYPTAGSTSCGIDDSMIIYFNEEVNANTFNNSNILLTDAFGIPVSLNNFQYQVVGGKTTLTIDPVSSLYNASTYTLNINDLTDMTGNSIPDYTLTFTTVNYTNRLQVSSASPANGDTNVSINPSLRLVFNKNVDSSSVNNNTVFLTDSTGNKVSATLNLSNSSGAATLTIVPTANLAYLSTYHLNIINNGAYALRDLSGQTMVATTLSFTTRSADQPTIISRTPEAYCMDVSPNALISITFSADMDANTLNNTNITLQKTGSGSVAIQPITYQSVTRTINIIPFTRLDAGTKYTVQLSSAVKGSNGVAMTAASWYFTTVGTTSTASGNTAIISRDPVAGATGVAASKVIRFQFNGVMESSTISSSTAYLSLGGSSIPASVTYENTTNWVSITPTNQLLNYTTYTINVSNSIKDVYGNSVTASSWTFTTANTGYIGNGSAYPYPNTTGVALDTDITYRFNTRMNSSTISRSNIYLTNSSGTAMTCSVSYNSNNYQVTITPSNDLKSYTTYTVTLSSAIEDYSGNSITPVVWSFTTGAYSEDEDEEDDNHYAEDYRAAVYDRNPDRDASNVALDASITFRFDKAMYTSSIDSDNIYLTRNGSRVPGAVSYYTSSRTVTLTPDYDLQPNSEYAVHATSDIQDYDGYHINSTTWSFKTRGSQTSSSSSGSLNPLSGTANHPLVVLNGQYLNFEVQPYIKNGRTFLPYRALLDALGASSVNWDSKLRKVSAALDNNQIELTIGYKVIVKNGQSYLMDVAPEITNNRTMIPLRFVTEALGFTTDWDANNHLIYLTK